MGSANIRRSLGLMVFMSLAILGLPGAHGQANGGPEGTVTGTGTASIERHADVLRMQVELSAEGKDAAEAIANLRAAEKSAREKMAKLGAEGDAVELAEARVGMGANDQRSQMARMMQMRSGRAVKPSTQPAQPSVAVSATFKVEWRLKGQTADELLVEAQDMQTKVKGAGLTASAKAGKTPEDEEAVEEAALMAAQEGQPNPNDPVFLYVYKISREEQSKATADAFKRAREEASILAKAADADLGSLRQLSSTAGSDSDAARAEYLNSYAQVAFQAMQRAQGGTVANGEATGTTPGKVLYRVVVSASFSLK